MKTKLVQISSGKGPAECERAAARVLEKFLKEARSLGIRAEVLHKTNGCFNGTIRSALVRTEIPERSEEHTSELQSRLGYIVIAYSVFCV